MAIQCDVTDEQSCRSAIADASDQLSGIDVLIYAAGIGWLSPVEDVRADGWHQLMSTNVVGASLATAAALPALRQSQGLVLYLSSISASLGRPWPGLGAYTVSKAALDRLVEVYRGEHPDVRFTRVVVGDCGGDIGGPGQCGFAEGWEVDLVKRFLPVWQERGYFTGRLMEITDFLDGVEFLVRTGARVPTVWLTP
jgi:NAD(P)-dependent dehydrogenase (short-subunit alcohol dehydrogenase family)